MTPIFDLEYVDLRNKLIPLAEAWANATTGNGSGLMYYALEKWREDWSRAFANRMQSLAMERGLTCGTPREREMLHAS